MARSIIDLSRSDTSVHIIYMPQNSVTLHEDNVIVHEEPVDAVFGGTNFHTSTSGDSCNSAVVNCDFDNIESLSDEQRL